MVEHREAAAIVFLLLLHSLFVLLYENALAKRVSKLKEKLYKLKSPEGCDVVINEKAPLDVQITEIEHQAERLGFCYRCRLYQDKVTQDSLQKTEECPKYFL